MKLLLAIVFIGIVTVAAQVPQRCKTPSTWNGHVARVELGQTEQARIRGRIAYDELNERFRILEQYEFRNKESDYFFGRYFIYKEKTEYRVNFTTKVCDRRLLNETFRPFSIPDDAKYIDTVEIGSNAAQGNGVEVYIWGGETLGGGFFTGQWTTEACIPVSDTYIRPPYFFTTTFFYDVEAGFDPKDFVLPDFC